jgi:hypothetical protein
MTSKLRSPALASKRTTGSGSVGATFRLGAMLGVGRSDGVEKTSLISLTSEERDARGHTWREHSGAGTQALDSPLEEDGFELAVPSRRERLWAATPGKHCRFGPEPVSGSAFRAAVYDWQRPEEPFAGAGPMV